MKYVTKDGKEFDDLTEAEAHESGIDLPGRTIKFSGHSDDIVLVTNYERLGEEEFCEKKFGLIGPDGKMKITAVYDGCWSFAVGLWDEDCDFPEWEIEHGYFGYTMNLYIKVPARTVFVVNPR